MKRNTGILISIILCVLMVFIGMNVPAFNAKAEEPGYVDLGGSVYITDDTMSLKINNEVIEGGEKFIKDAGIQYDSASHKLTLENVCLTGDSAPLFEIESSTDFTVELIGDNYLKKDAGDTFRATFGENENTITFTGSGTLNTIGGQGISSDQSIVFDGIDYYGESVNQLFYASKDVTITDCTMEALDAHYMIQVDGALTVKNSNLKLESKEITIRVLGELTIKDSALDLFSRTRDAIGCYGAISIDHSTIKAQNGTEQEFAGVECIHANNDITISNNSQVDINSYQMALSGANIAIFNSTLNVTSTNVALSCNVLSIQKHSSVDVKAVDSFSPAVRSGKISIDNSTVKASGYQTAIGTGEFRAAYSNIDFSSEKNCAVALAAESILFYDCITKISANGADISGSDTLSAAGLCTDGRVQIYDGTMTIESNSNNAIGIQGSEVDFRDAKVEITAGKTAVSSDVINITNADDATILGGATKESATEITAADMKSNAYAKITPNSTDDKDEPFYLGGFNILIEKDGVYFDGGLVTNNGKTLKELGVTYDAANHILTLDNVNLKTTGTIITNTVAPNLTINIKGNNTIISNSYLLYDRTGSAGTLTFTGDGTLNLDMYYFIEAQKPVVISDVTINADTVEEFLKSTADVTLNKATINAPKNSNLIVTTGELTVTDSTVDVSARNTIFKAGEISIEGSTIQGSSKNEYGIFATKNLTIDHSDITMTAGCDKPTLCTYGNITIKNDSNIDAKSLDNSALFADYNIAIEGSNVIANADKAGIFCKTLAVADSEMTAEAGVIALRIDELVLDDSKLMIIGGADGASAVAITKDDLAKQLLFVQITAKKDGWQVVDGNKYYYENNAAFTGLRTIEDKKYYFDETGVMQTGWVKAFGKWYYFGTDGAMQTGWVKDAGKWYYFGANGQMQIGWVKDAGKWYYFAASGAMKTGWVKDDGKWYYFGTNGAMVTKWQKIDNKWYYFGTNGAMATKWQKIDNKWYYFDAEGVMVTGWKQIDSVWYYFDNGVMVTGWKQIKNVWYYFDGGAMVTGKQTIGGKTYTFDSTGAWIK